MKYNRTAVQEQVVSWRSQGQRIGFTSGAFDLLHAGHVEYLNAARQCCDRLVVGVNSDSSVKLLKGELRPIVPEQARAELLGALRCVDAVFIFEERNNNKNIEFLKPDIYIKAGDYTKEQLSSTPIVEAYGGQVRIVPFKDGFSTTHQIDEILARYGSTVAVDVDSGSRTTLQPGPAVFLDRDGTLIKYVEHLHQPEQVELLPGVAEGLRKLRAAGFMLVVATNQPGIELGYFSQEDFFRTNSRMLQLLAGEGVMLDKVYFSPASRPDLPSGRKPAPTMAQRAEEDLGVDLKNSFMIGDSQLDIGFAQAAGLQSVLVLSGKSTKDESQRSGAEYVAANFALAVDWIIREASSN